MGEELGMAWKRETAIVERLLMDGVGHQSANLTLGRKLNRQLDRADDSGCVGRIWRARGRMARQRHVEYGQRVGIDSGRRARIINALYGHVDAEADSHLFQASRIINGKECRNARLS